MSQEPPQDLESRILALLDETVNEKEVARLDAELRGSREARDLYQQLVLLHVSLQEQATAQSGLEKVPVIPIERLLASQRRRMVKASLLAAAAVLVISALGLWIKSVRIPDPVARFELGPDTAFILTHTGDDKAPMGNVLAEGSKLQLTRGTMEGVFGSGVRCVIEAPCDLTVLADDRISVAEGVAWFEVPSAAVGFTVETAQLTVVDLGTEFGVVARTGGGHEVHVIEGSVAVTLTGTRDEGARTILGQSESRQVVAGSLKSIPARPGGFATRLPERIPLTNPSFEMDRNPDSRGLLNKGDLGDLGGQLTGWITRSGNLNMVQVGWRGVLASDLHPHPPPKGRSSQALSLMAGASVQNVASTPWSRLEVGDRLTLTVALGLRAGKPALRWNDQTFFGLTDGGFPTGRVPTLEATVAHSGRISVNPATGTLSGDGRFRDMSLVHTVREEDLRRPGNIGILLVSRTSKSKGATNQAFFDHVRLHLSRNPEPSVPPP